MIINLYKPGGTNVGGATGTGAGTTTCCRLGVVTTGLVDVTTTAEETEETG